MKYKVGDKVRVREDLEVGKVYGLYLYKEMAELKGKVVEIEDLCQGDYSIKESIYYWAEEMFSGLAEEPRNLMPLIARELGVEMGEEFNIVEGFYNPYRFSETDLLDRDGSIALNSLRRLLNGEFNIEKLPKKPRLTKDERVVLRNIPEKYKYIARDNSGELYIYKGKPYKEREEWYSLFRFNELNLFQDLFQFIKWEDEEPYNIEELLKGE